MKIRTILDYIDDGEIALPEFQRGFVWNRNQVRGLMDSLYRRHPVGSLLSWSTRTERATHRGSTPMPPGNVKLLLDGQQRVTSLYGIIRGNPPPFFEGNANTFSDLYFNMETQTFEFYGPVRMHDNPRWISVTALMQRGIGQFNREIYRNETLEPMADEYTDRLNRIYTIMDIDLHIDEVTGEDKTVDIVVDIFNRVNSGGTKLTKGDLALAKICAEWPDARAELSRRLEKWKSVGFAFKLEWLLRCVNCLVTGEALFSALADVEWADISNGLRKSEKHIDYLLNLISSRLGLDHDRVLGSVYSFPIMVRYVEQRGGQITDHKERDRLLFWYIHTLLWGRYSGSTETILNQDLQAIVEINEGLDRLTETLRRNRGDLRIDPQDFDGATKGARFYPLLYMLTRVHHAKDWCSGLDLSNHLLGKLNSLQMHHIFPKSKLYEYGYERNEVNALANFTFLTQECNIEVSNKNPEDYLKHFASSQPGVIESHWIPMDPELWKLENYRRFLSERRKLLAQAANEFLDDLIRGNVQETVSTGSVLDGAGGLGGVISEAEEQLLIETNIWVIDQGLPEGELSHELINEYTGELLAVLDLAWPDGIQEGFSQPVALLIDENTGIEKFASQAGFRIYTDQESLKHYVNQEILAIDEAAD